MVAVSQGLTYRWCGGRFPILHVSNFGSELSDRTRATCRSALACSHFLHIALDLMNQSKYMKSFEIFIELVCRMDAVLVSCFFV